MEQAKHHKYELAAKLRACTVNRNPRHRPRTRVRPREGRLGREVHKGAHSLTTHLEKKDADGCMEGVQCVYLGVQLAQLIRNFEGA